MKLFEWIKQRKSYLMLKGILPDDIRLKMRKKLQNLCSLIDSPYSYFYSIIYDWKVKSNCFVEREFKHTINEKRIHSVYFTCNKHFKYLLASLQSLEELNLDFVGDIYIYIDKSDLISAEKISRLEDSYNGLRIIINQTKYKFQKGLTRILSELDALREINKSISREDYIAKVDSDVIFLSGISLRKVLESESSIVGKTYTDPDSNFTYIRGGCYFLKGRIVSSITHCPITHIVKKAGKLTGHLLTNCPEDAAIFSLAKQYTDEFEFLDDLYSMSKFDQSEQHRILVR